MIIVIKSSLSGEVVAEHKCKSKAEANKLVDFINENMKSTLRFAEVK